MKIIFTTILMSITLLSAEAQIEKLAGPRVGVTMITPGSLSSIIRGDVSMFSDEVREEWTGSTGKYGAAITQYGWQWESRFADGGNVTGIVEWIALVGGMEKGYFLPSVSSMVGLRTDKGLEFAVGPNLSLGGIAMVFGAGYNFKFGKLNVPVNIAYVPSMNKTYNHEVKYDYVELYDEDGNDIGYEVVTPKYSVIHPTGARISVMLGFNLSK
jgi:hypothetical protein